LTQEGVMIIKLSDDSAHEEVKIAMENIALFRICVTIDEYQIASNGNYLLFAGLDENQDFVDAFMAMDLERESDELTDETALSVLAKTYADAELPMLSGAQAYSNDAGSMFQIENMINKDETLDLNNYIDAIQLQNNTYDELVFMIHLSDTSNIDEIKTSFHSLANAFS